MVTPLSAAACKNSGEAVGLVPAGRETRAGQCRFYRRPPAKGCIRMYDIHDHEEIFFRHNFHVSRVLLDSICCPLSERIHRGRVEPHHRAVLEVVTRLEHLTVAVRIADCALSPCAYERFRRHFRKFLNAVLSFDTPVTLALWLVAR